MFTCTNINKNVSWYRFLFVHLVLGSHVIFSMEFVMMLCYSVDQMWPCVELMISQRVWCPTSSCCWSKNQTGFSHMISLPVNSTSSNPVLWPCVELMISQQVWCLTSSCCWSKLQVGFSPMISHRQYILSSHIIRYHKVFINYDQTSLSIHIVLSLIFSSCLQSSVIKQYYSVFSHLTQQMINSSSPQ